MNSRSKGCRGERVWRDFLREHGFTARRGQQFAGGTDAPDVICEEMEALFHPEVKFVENLNVYKAIEQAMRDCPENKKHYVAHRKNRKDWLVTMPAVEWIEIIKIFIDRINNK